MICKLCSLICCLVFLVPTLIFCAAYLTDNSSAITLFARFSFESKVYCDDNKTQVEVGGWFVGKPQRLNGTIASITMSGRTIMLGKYDITNVFHLKEGKCARNVAFEDKFTKSFTGKYCDVTGKDVFDASLTKGFYVTSQHEIGHVLHDSTLYKVTDSGTADVTGGMTINHPTLGALHKCKPAGSAGTIS